MEHFVECFLFDAKPFILMAFKLQLGQKLFSTRMEYFVTIESYIALFSAMFIVGIIPGPAVFAITTASMTGGFRRGAAMTLGLIIADYFFILLAVSGLAFIADAMGSAFTIIKYICAAYLIWMGIKLFMSKPQQICKKPPVPSIISMYWQVFY
nr:LysE family translocator [Pseudoalteromonas luteoviolacea]